MVYVEVITSQSVITQRRYVKNLSYFIMFKWNYHISSAVQVRPRGWFDMKTQPLPYKISHCRNKTILWPSAQHIAAWCHIQMDTQGAIIASFLHQNDIAAPFERNNDGIITSCVCWDTTFSALYMRIQSETVQRDIMTYHARIKANPS